MANPTNAQLPNFEYIEICNTGDATIDLSNYQLQINQTRIDLLPRYLAARQFLILTHMSNSAPFERFGNVMPLPRWQALNNTGASISIIDKEGLIADVVSYTDRWYGTASKRSGGWSLERINPNILCSSSLNWHASEAMTGGTPGQRNSVWDEQYQPDLKLNVLTTSTQSVTLSFAADLETIPQIKLQGVEIYPQDVLVTAIEIEDKQITLLFSAPIRQDKPYELLIEVVEWCNLHFQFSLPLFHASETQYNDIVINEVLFNPKNGGVDFVELYNRSDKTVNLQNWQLGNRTITQEQHLFSPFTYRVLTANPEVVKKHYPQARTENFITLPSLPSYANERGEVILSLHGKTIDSLAYFSSMHQPFLSDVKGISLERQDSQEDTNSLGNFTSASTLAGGATPGYRNSAHVEKNLKNNNLQLLTRTFSPNDDGFEDNLQLEYTFSEENPMINLQIFDDKGRVINRLIRNKSAGQHGNITWDGKDENGQPCAGGIYIFQAEVYTSKGHFQTFKGSFVLVRDSPYY